MSASRDKFLAQLERCVLHQKEGIVLPDPPRVAEEIIGTSEYIAPEVMGNGAADVEGVQSVWGLRPPGDEGPPMYEYVEGDWA